MGFNFKLDLKSLLILILLGTCILFFAMWYFRGSNTKEQVKKLEKEINKIELVRDSLQNANKILEIEFDKKQKEIDNRDIRIKKYESELIKTKQDLTKANDKVKEYQKELSETKKKIEELEKNPIKREGDDLINSLKEKLK